MQNKTLALKSIAKCPKSKTLGNNQARKTEIKKTQNKEKSEKFSVFHLVERRQNKEKSENPELERDKEIESYRIMHKDGRRS